ncbi:MAG: M48 family metallopeptidase [Gammaproteobacteria bacterium]|jgi:predicted Zn-dependent protease
MEYHNPIIPEGINTSKEHPLKEFFILVVGVIGLLATVLFVLSLVAEHLAQYIPFSAEQQIAGIYENTIPADSNVDPYEEKIQSYLQKLADQLSGAEDLEEGMSVKVHYINDDTVNAFATLGGHIVMFRGLLEKVPDENTLSMVMAHEIAHVKHRHPIKALGRAVIVGVALSVLSTNLGDSMTSRILGDAGLLTTLKFSRDQETQSDNTAMMAMASHYGHISGADTLFEILQKEQDENNIKTPEFLSTHPLSSQRIQNVNNRATQSGWSLDQEITPLPEEFNEWLAGSRQAQKVK